MLYVRDTINLSQKNLTGYPLGRYCLIHDPGMLNGIKVLLKIVAKALNGQRYPLPLCELMWV